MEHERKQYLSTKMALSVPLPREENESLMKARKRDSGGIVGSGEVEQGLAIGQLQGIPVGAGGLTGIVIRGLVGLFSGR